jgi:hypothetical protein
MESTNSLKKTTIRESNRKELYGSSLDIPNLVLLSLGHGGE